MGTLGIQQATAHEAYTLSLQIPEFAPWYPWTKWEERLDGKRVIILVAFSDGKPAGFKAGYYVEDHFYSWVGGVLPAFRRQGVAALLAEEQEAIVRASGVQTIRMKTRNRFRGMLHFALKRGYYLTAIEQRGDPEDWRITLVKNL